MADNNEVKQIVETVEGIVKAVPVYQDMLQPAAKQIGKGLETVVKTIHIVLAPIKALTWGYEQIEDFIESRVTEKLKNVPKERIQEPNPLVAGPLLASLRFAGHEETLRELYANLLATSMDSATAQNAHLAFVEIIRNMLPDEARVMKFLAKEKRAALIDIVSEEISRISFMPSSAYSRTFIRNFSHIGKEANCNYPQLISSYIDNLCRLGLLEIPHGKTLIIKSKYEELESDEQLGDVKKQIEVCPERQLKFERKIIMPTDLGWQFCSACVVDKQ